MYCTYGGSEYGSVTQDAMGLAVNNDTCPDFGYIHIM